jgi:hypothetical protein
VITKLSLIDVEADALELLGATSIPYASVVRCQALKAPVSIAAALQVNAENLTLIVGGPAARVYFVTGGWAVARTVFGRLPLRLILSAPSTRPTRVALRGFSPTLTVVALRADNFSALTAATPVRHFIVVGQSFTSANVVLERRSI